MDKRTTSRSYRISGFTFNAKTLALSCERVPVKIEPLVAQLLGYFVDHKSKVLTRDELIAFLWPNRIVTDDALRSAIKKLREILNDDAKAPQFIKTLPMKGYEFIAEVELITPSQQKTIGSIKALIGIAVLCLFCVVALGIWQSSKITNSTNRPVVDKLTDIAGSELSPSFDPVNNRLIFSHRSNKDDFLQLYVKDIAKNKVSRLTWDEANYGNVMWSPSGEYFAYIRSTKTEKHHYVSKFDANKGMTEIKQLVNESLSSRYLMAWSHSNNAIYVTDKPGPSNPQSIWRYDINSNAFEQITSPSVPGQGDYFVKESSDGVQLAILRNLSLNKHELLVLHLETGEILYNRQLPQKMHRLVWNEENTTITLGNFEGTMLQVQLSSPEIEDITPNVDFVNNLFYQCGDNCYYMRQHNGNYLDIAEQPNPFIQQNTGSFGYFEFGGANDFPMYANTSSNLYFVSQYSKNTIIEYIDNSGMPTKVMGFGKLAEIQSIDLNKSDTHFVGLVDSSLFVYDIVSDSLTYLSKQTDIVYPPHWLDEHTFVYAKLEKNEAMLYKYSILDRTSTFLMSGYVSLLELGDNAQLLIDKNYRVWMKEKNTLKDIGILPSSQPNRFKLINNELYYTGREENTNVLYRITIDSGKISKFEIAKNRFKANFDISANQEKLAVVESLLAQSDLVKLTLK
jgi:transcriptional activator of cad operon